MAKVLISPGKYVQGAGEMKKLGEYAQNYGKKALILISKGGYKRIGAMVEKSFEGKECGYVFDYFNGECSKKEIKRLGEIVKKEACDVVIGIGGGKIFDTAKAVAYYEKTPVLICPTIASTDAPCSALSVIYTDEGETADSWIERKTYELNRNGDKVFVVTSDYAEQINILGSGAYRISAREFREEYKRAKKQIEEKVHASACGLGRNELGGRLHEHVRAHFEKLRRR